MYRVRFNLQHGKHYKHWQVKCMDTKEVKYFDPDTTSLVLSQCRLVNKRDKAEKIFKRDTTKVVCAWVECAYFSVEASTEGVGCCKGTWVLEYNPRSQPFWIYERTLDNIDNHVFPFIVSHKNKLLEV